MAMAVQADLASVAWHMGHGAHRSTWPGCEKSYLLFYFSKKLLQGVKTCKMHRKISVRRKNAYDITKCSEKHALHFSINFMHC
jgi:hypothetical protein